MARIKFVGNELRLNSGKLLAIVEPDVKYPKMWRVRIPDGSVSDMANLTRIKDAAQSLALDRLNVDVSPDQSGRRTKVAA